MTPELTVLCEQLSNWEPRYHAAAPTASLADFDRLVADDFWEIGASGRHYSREYARRVLQQRVQTPPESDWVTTDYCLTLMADNLYLLTYSLTQFGRQTLRSSLWQRNGDQWQVRFHQGTVVQVDFTPPLVVG